MDENMDRLELGLQFSFETWVKQDIYLLLMSITVVSNPFSFIDVLNKFNYQ